MATERVTTSGAYVEHAGTGAQVTTTGAYVETSGAAIHITAMGAYVETDQPYGRPLLPALGVGK